jgi:hypothetical protein
MAVDLGVMRDEQGSITGETRCGKCGQRLCECPERQADGGWINPAGSPEERIAALEKQNADLLAKLKEKEVITETEVAAILKPVAEPLKGGSPEGSLPG